jgi:hypothetical protein
MTSSRSPTRRSKGNRRSIQEFCRLYIKSNDDDASEQPSNLVPWVTVKRALSVATVAPKHQGLMRLNMAAPFRAAQSALAQTNCDLLLGELSLISRKAPK